MRSIPAPEGGGAWLGLGCSNLRRRASQSQNTSSKSGKRRANIFFTQNLGESHNPISLYVYNSHFSETPALNLGFYFVHALVLANRCKILWGENFQRWTWSSRKNKQIFTSELFAFKSRNIRNYARAHANSI